MERDDRAPVATFFSASPFDASTTVTLSEGPAHHARVKRLVEGDVVRLTDGAGAMALGSIAAVRRDELTVTIGGAISRVARPAVIHLAVPIGDRDRTLWLAEKATELGVTSWRPVHFQRSASVAARSDGPGFARKLDARMISALEQSGGAWLPEILPDATIDSLIGIKPRPADVRLLLDRQAPSLWNLAPLARGAEPIVLFGPEGGIEPRERDALVGSGWQPASLADVTLRFETAGIAAVAVLRAMHAMHAMHEMHTSNNE